MLKMLVVYFIDFSIIRFTSKNYFEKKSKTMLYSGFKFIEMLSHFVDHLKPVYSIRLHLHA
jgi:hypothetical protein